MSADGPVLGVGHGDALPCLGGSVTELSVTDNYRNLAVIFIIWVPGLSQYRPPQIKLQNKARLEGSPAGPRAASPNNGTGLGQLNPGVRYCLGSSQPTIIEPNNASGKKMAGLIV
jgi:hypothetical protein